MAANFQQQHMGGPGGMMSQQQMQQQQQQMQQRQQQQRAAQGNIAAPQTQIQQIIYNHLNQQGTQPVGWQIGVLLTERIGLIVNIIGNLRLISRQLSSDLNKMIEVGLRFEKEIFDKASSKEDYKQQIHAKVQQLQDKRREAQPAMQQQINQQAQLQAQQQQQQAQAQAQQMMMQNPMQGQASRAMAQQPSQQSYQHLQHQMQASLLPGQSQQGPIGIPNQGGHQGMNPAQQQQLQMMQQAAQGMPNRPPNNPQFGGDAEFQQQVNDKVSMMLGSMSEQDKNSARITIQSRMDPNLYQNWLAKGVDPLYLYTRQQAINQMRNEKMRMQQQMAAQQNQNLPPSATPMQQQRSVNPSPSVNGQAQAAMSMGGGNFQFPGNMDAMAVQQRLENEQAGQSNLPMNIPRNSTPQPPGGMNMNDQRMAPNSNARVQQQQMFNAQQAQQAQQQRLQHAAQQQQQQSQAQAQARLNAQAKAQQMPLNGQPGGMGLGAMPSQQTPIMTTLNAPLRTPNNQLNQHEIPEGNPNQQFGQQIEAAFMQQNGQRQPNQGNAINMGAITQAMVSTMSAEQQAQLRGLSRDQLNEVVRKWHQLNPRSGMGNNGLRPGQPGPQGQFNPQNAASQLMPGQQRNNAQNMMASITQQQLLQQQMANLARGSQMMPGMVGGPNPPPQMDHVEVPPQLLHHTSLPQGIPPEIKNWAQLKSWVQSNPALGQPVSDNVAQLQRLHYLNLVKRQREAAAAQGNPQNGPGNMPAVGGAPTAPMGPNVPNIEQVRQMQNRMGMANIPPPSQQEVDLMRRSGGEKTINLTDDQLRQIIIRNKMAHLRERQAMMAAQASGQQLQQPRPAQQNHNQMNQPFPGPTPQPKPPQPVAIPPPSAQSVANTAAANRAQASRNSVQNSSPAQPVNKLKRQSSDDVVEVPNPNPPQQPRTNSQMGPGASHPAQGSRMPTAAQLAGMSPEVRKNFERVVSMTQAKTAGKTAGPSDQERLQAIMKEEQEKESRRTLTDIPMSDIAKAEMATRLRETANHLTNVMKIIPRWFQITHDESKAREFFHTRYRITKQFRDNELKIPKDNFNITLEEIEISRRLLAHVVSDLTKKFPDMTKPNGPKSQQPPAANQQTPSNSQSSAAGASTPLSSANLRQQQQQLDKIHQRRSSHTPAAPTQSVPPFQFGAASPHGTPIYSGKNTLAQENLHIPARKKQKQNAGQGTPGSSASPQVTKANSPDLKRQQAPQAEPKTHQKPSLCCPESECERHTLGFDSEEALKTHTYEEHVKPLENPHKWVKDSLDASLGLDSSQGKLKTPAAEPSQENASAPTAAKMVASGSRQGQTPNIKGENMSIAGTPMMRQASMNRQGSSSGQKSQVQPKGGAPLKDGAQEASKGTPKQSERQPTQDIKMADPWANSTIDPHELAQNFRPFATGANGAISNLDAYRSITPNDTPESSKDGASEPNSDITEGVALDINLDIYDDDWKPFGISDTDALDLNSFNFGVSEQDDFTMFDDDQQASKTFESWDDMIDPTVFDRPFSSLDTSQYMMNAN